MIVFGSEEGATDEVEKKKEKKKKLADCHSALSLFLLLPHSPPKTMETAAPSPGRSPPFLEEPPETVAGPRKGPEKREKNTACRMPDDASSMTPHLRRLLLLLALVATQLLSALGFALRWLGHALEELAGERRR